MKEIDLSELEKVVGGYHEDSNPLEPEDDDENWGDWPPVC